jgi:hypothetical protein
MTKQDWLAKAEEIDHKIEELMGAEDAGSAYLEYLHAKAEACRFLAVDAADE